MTNSLSVFKHATVLDHVPQSFRGCVLLDTSSSTERPSLVKLPIEESMVKLLPSTSSRSSYYLTSLFINLMRLTRDG